MINKAILVLCIVLTGFVVFWGQHSWSKQQESIHTHTATPVSNKESEDKAADEPKSVNTNPADSETLSNLISNQPENVQKMWLEHQQNDRPVDITFVASGFALLSEENWTTLLEDEMTAVYEDEDLQLNFTVVEWEGNSVDWLTSIKNSSTDFAEADLVVYEIPTIYDNGEVEPEDQQINMEEFISFLLENYPDTHLFVQPSQPLYNAAIYPEHVAGVRLIAEQLNIPYLDHWTDWPDSDDPELENYLTEDSDPNELGNSTWGTYLSNYFTGN
ncbi:SGNH/GDSL hydrolase family protein [Jeotgalibacillus soli]|uniref:SGNH/GDSL hydrolase family protein n=1 Tax=Jeotgalibacillus soli TaxID=889306 RepID=A0A0C2VZS3_9BACL|nr:SGNH/GDSL hydrolase family protein [Jeotgalibacillus soli]KIL49871.1 hypothetical protein KP78_13390 [Jeotgalibacillus soli]